MFTVPGWLGEGARVTIWDAGDWPGVLWWLLREEI